MEIEISLAGIHKHSSLAILDYFRIDVGHPFSRDLGDNDIGVAPHFKVKLIMVSN